MRPAYRALGSAFLAIILVGCAAKWPQIETLDSSIAKDAWRDAAIRACLNMSGPIGLRSETLDLVREHPRVLQAVPSAIRLAVKEIAAHPDAIGQESVWDVPVIDYNILVSRVFPGAARLPLPRNALGPLASEIREKLSPLVASGRIQPPDELMLSDEHFLLSTRARVATETRMLARVTADSSKLVSALSYAASDFSSSSFRAGLSGKVASVPWWTMPDALELVKRVYPSVYRNAVESFAVTLRLISEPERELLVEDVAARLKERAGDAVRVVGADEAASIRVAIRELRYLEKEFPEQVQTGMVGYNQMNILTAVLFYPENSMALYDVHRGGAEIEYAYRITVEDNGKAATPHLLQGVVSDQYEYGTNLRWKNVFGGEQAASAYPTVEVQRLFEARREPIRARDLRARVAEDIVDFLMKVESIQGAAVFASRDAF